MEKKRQIDQESISRNVARQEWYAAFDPNQGTNRKSESKDKHRQREFPKLVAVHQRNDPWSELSAGELDDKQYRGGTNHDQCEQRGGDGAHYQSRRFLAYGKLPTPHASDPVEQHHREQSDNDAQCRKDPD